MQILVDMKTGGWWGVKEDELVALGSDYYLVDFATGDELEDYIGGDASAEEIIRYARTHGHPLQPTRE